LKEGKFSAEESAPDHLNKETSYYISQLLKAIHPDDLIEIKMNRNIRDSVLKSLESYYAWHVPEFGQMKTLTVLHEVI
jgi:DNA repair protein RecO (recombination protein O)